MATVSDQDVDARLWQDPLRLAQEHQQRLKPKDVAKDASRRLESLTEWVGTFGNTRDTTGGPLLILPVMIPGGPYVESGERRLRARQAVLTALGAEQFAPKDGEHIGYFEVSLVTKGQEPEGASKLLIPFERFRFFGPRSEMRSSQVLVLWVCDDVPEIPPLAVLYALGEKLQWTKPDVGLRIIGPSSSSGVYRILEEIKYGSASRHRELADSLAGAEIISPMSTVSEDAFRNLLDFSKPGETGEFIAKRIGDALKVPFYRTIITDDLVAKALAYELKLRGIKLTPQDLAGSDSARTGSIALIAEWDTFYGRVLPLTFAQQLSRGLIKDGDKEEPNYRALIESNAKWPRSIEPFYYLRGIDGRSAEEGKEKQETSVSNRERPTNVTEGTEGENQADYLRRLVGLLKTRHKELLHEGGGGFKAIGVLGSDVYDKLMVLRALRKEFPGVLFFSNNLDARMAIQEEWKAAHNLVVASPFGLQLHPTLQAKSAPFRDSYQTSMYAGARLALGNDTFRRDFQNETPRIFEIGRHGPVDLSGPSLGKWDPSRTKVEGEREKVSPLFPDRLDQRRWLRGKSESVRVKRIALVALSTLLVCTVAVMIVLKASWISVLEGGSDRIPLRNAFQTLLQSTRAMFVVACGFAAVVMLGFWLNRDVNSESFDFFSGISAWPALSLQIVIAVLALHFIYRATRELRKSECDVSKEIGDLKAGAGLQGAQNQGGPAIPQTALWSVKLDAWLGWKSRGIRPPTFVRDEFIEEGESGSIRQDEEPVLLPEVIWREYLERGRVRSNLIYMTMMAAIVIMLGVIAAQIWPSSGHPMRDMNMLPWILFPTALGLGTVLTLYTYQAIRLHCDLVNLFNLGRTDWPKTLIAANPRNRFLSKRSMCEYLDVRLIAVNSEAAVKIVQYPFLIMVLLVVSTASYFDNWTKPAGLLLIYAFNLIMAVIAAITLARAAERARQRALRNLRRERFRKLAENAPSNSGGNEGLSGSVAPMNLPPLEMGFASATNVATLQHRGTRIEKEESSSQPDAAAPDPRWQETQLRVLDEVIAEVGELHRGALAPMWEQPVFKAVLYSIGSLGLGSLVQHMSWLF